MSENAHRRGFLQGTFVVGAMTLLSPGTACAEKSRSSSASLSPEEKQRLKEELQRELERKVYSVDESLFRKVNRLRDPARPEGHERSHVPKITAPRKVRRLEVFTVKIEVGVEEIHEMQVFHYIDWIGLRVDDVQISSITVTPLFTRPVVTLELTLEKSATLFAQEHCNLHGTWESEPWRIEVEGEATK